LAKPPVLQNAPSCGTAAGYIAFLESQSAQKSRSSVRGVLAFLGALAF
jgi:hypothetical protein